MSAAPPRGASATPLPHRVSPHTPSSVLPSRILTKLFERFVLQKKSNYLLVDLPHERRRLWLCLCLRFFFAGAWGVVVDKAGLTRVWPPLASLLAAPSLPLGTSGQPAWEQG